MVTPPSGASAVRYTRAGIAAATLLALILVWLFPSVIDLWYVIGSVIIPGLLLPVAGVYYAGFRVSSAEILTLLGVPVLVSLGWLVGGMMAGGRCSRVCATRAGAVFIPDWLFLWSCLGISN